MKISIFGMGYVGCVTAACLASLGNELLCVEIVDEKVATLQKGKWPVFENGLDDLCPRGRDGFEKIEVSADYVSAIKKTEMSIVCVGTPAMPDGRVDLSHIARTVKEIAEAVRALKKEHVLIIRSTIPPGTIENEICGILREYGVDGLCQVAHYPEFLREGSAVSDFFKPSLNVLGCREGFPEDVIKRAFKGVDSPLIVTAIKTAEAIKYANNSFHALKIAFVNEFAMFCKSYDVDSREVMDIFCEDKVLNISPYYLRPGFAFGGSCLPKELNALITLCKKSNVDPILFKAVVDGNEQIMKKLLSLIFDFNKVRLGFFGLTFKPDTDDMRESPVLKVIEKMLSKTPTYSKKFEILACDRPEVLEAINRTYNGQIQALLKEDELVEKSELIVLGPYKIQKKTESLIAESGKPVINLNWHTVSADLSGYEKYYSLI